jgi:hypothetical protein
MAAQLPRGDALRLTIELVPQTCWYSNLRAALPRAEWDRLRRRVYRRFGHRCAICGAAGRLNCHERWSYDDAARVQRLDGFVALCEWCHHVKHLGLAELLAARGELDGERLVQHFMRVNGCDRATFAAHRREAFRVWAARSAHPWRTELGAVGAVLE